MSQHENMYLAYAVEIDEAPHGFLLPIFVSTNDEAPFIQVCQNGIIQSFERIETAKSHHRIKFPNSAHVATGGPIWVVYRSTEQRVFCGTVKKLTPLLEQELTQLKNEDAALKIQIAYAIGRDVELAESRLQFSYIQSRTNNNRGYDAYKNSVAREVGWNSIERAIGSDAELRAKFECHRSDFDFYFDENQNLKVALYNDDELLSEQLLSEALASARTALEGTFKNPPAFDGDQLELPIDEDGWKPIPTYISEGRQETRFARLLASMLQSPDDAGKLLERYRDRAKYATSMAQKLKERLVESNLIENDLESLIARFLDTIYNEAFYANRGIMLLELARYVGQFPKIHDAIIRRLEMSNSWQTNRYREEIELELSNHSIPRVG